MTCEGVNGEQVPAVGLPDPHEVLRGYAHLQGRIQISGRGEGGGGVTDCPRSLDPFYIISH